MVNKKLYPYTIPEEALSVKELERPYKIWSLGPVIEYGRKLPSGAMPVFSVNTRSMATTLIGAACGLAKNEHGQNVHVSHELQYAANRRNLDYFRYRLWYLYYIVLGIEAKKEIDKERAIPFWSYMDLVKENLLSLENECATVEDSDEPVEADRGPADPTGDPYLDLP